MKIYESCAMEDTSKGTIVYKSFYFEKEAETRNMSYCEQCNVDLSPMYSNIIDVLIEKGLLDKDYPKLCCRCWCMKNEIWDLW